MRKCYVSLCHNSPVVFTDTAISLMGLGWGDRVQAAKDAHGFQDIDFGWSCKFPRVDTLRDAAVETAKHYGYTHILFLDADMKWPTDVLMRMLRHHDTGIVSGLYFLKGGAYSPVAMRDGHVPEGSKTKQYYYDVKYRESGNELRPEQVVGMGCTLIPMSVFDAIGPRPWFEYGPDDEGWPRVSEDVTFCQKAIEAGYSIWLDPTVKCQHGTINWVNEGWHTSVVDQIEMTSVA